MLYKLVNLTHVLPDFRCVVVGCLVKEYPMQSEVSVSVGPRCVSVDIIEDVVYASICIVCAYVSNCQRICYLVHFRNFSLIVFVKESVVSRSAVRIYDDEKLEIRVVPHAISDQLENSPCTQYKGCPMLLQRGIYTTVR